MASKGGGDKAARLATKTVTITPTLADEWLKRNTRNRPVLQQHIARLAEAMKNGNWAMTGESIKFSSTGLLLDGQHRLAACVLSGVPFRSLVVEGVEPDAYNRHAQGKKRSLGDAFGREKKKNAVCMAAACYTLFQLENKTVQRLHLPIDEGFAVLKRHPLVEKYTPLVLSFYRATMPIQPSIAAAYMTWTCESWGQRAATFWVRVCTGEDVPPKSPESMLIRVLRASANSTLTISARQSYCARAFNAAMTEKRLACLKFDPSREDVTEFLR